MGIELNPNFFCIFTSMKTQEQNWQNGLSQRHIAQIIRRKMITKTKQSGKIYNRKSEKLEIQ
jgi:hypothetical protein